MTNPSKIVIKYDEKSFQYIQRGRWFILTSAGAGVTFASPQGPVFQTNKLCWGQFSQNFQLLPELLFKPICFTTLRHSKCFPEKRLLGVYWRGNFLEKYEKSDGKKYLPLLLVVSLFAPSFLISTTRFLSPLTPPGFC